MMWVGVREEDIEETICLIRSASVMFYRALKLVKQDEIKRYGMDVERRKRKKNG